MSESQDQGRFVWYELLTTDTAAAIAFYKDVVGWETQPFEGSPTPYSMWTASQGPLGGVMTLPEEAAKMGAPPHWMGNVKVVDIDATVAKVQALGGKLYSGPHGIPTVGRVAVIADPQGASLAVFQPAGDMAGHDNTKPGEFSWSELMAVDHDAALKFYGELFGWKKLDAMDMGPMGQYVLFGIGDTMLGGMMNKPAEMPVAAWAYYIHVADLDASIAKALAGGAKLLNGPMDVPGGARVANLMDPQNAMFSLHGGGETAA